MLFFGHGTTGSATNPLGYAGAYTDSESGVIYLIGRYYDPVAALFLSVDPLVEATLQPYDYARQDPVNLYDPTSFRDESTDGGNGGAWFTGGVSEPTADPVTDTPGARPEPPVQPMLGEGGTQTTSTELLRNTGRGYRIDVENPAPGVRPGQLHLQTTGGRKYMYNFEANRFEGLSNAAETNQSRSRCAEGDRESTRNPQRSGAMNGERHPLTLTSDLDNWEVKLRNGGTLHVKAHGVKEGEGHYTFVAFMAGAPAVEYELARLSTADVESYEGGWPTPR